jgi:hypothetical protein
MAWWPGRGTDVRELGSFETVRAQFITYDSRAKERKAKVICSSSVMG